MAEIEIRLPKMGESVTEATITNWLKQPGDQVAMDEPLVEVATDKVDNELPSEAAGILIKCLFEKDQVAQVGDVIAIISTDTNAVVAEISAPVIAETPLIVATENNTTVEAIAPTENIENFNTGDRFYSPLVKSIAQKEGLSSSELNSISGTGLEGRVTKKDLISRFLHSCLVQMFNFNTKLNYENNKY